MKFKFWLFDWDGCLADSLPVWLEAYRICFADFGVKVEDEQIVRIFGDWQGPEKLGIREIDKFSEKLVAEAEKLMPGVRLHPGAKKVLARLEQESIPYAIVTSSLKKLLLPIARREKLAIGTGMIVDGTEVGKHKPDPEAVFKGLEIIGGQPKRAIFVGDSVKDVEAGKNAGVTSCLFYPEANRRFYPEEMVLASQPDKLIYELEELLEWV